MKFPKITWEWVIAQNPDVILKYKSEDTIGWENGPSKDSVELQKSRNELLGRAGAGSITAVEDDRIYLCYSEMLYGLDNAVGLAYMAKLLHPEANADPNAVWDEYKELLGMNICLSRSKR